MAPQHYSEVSVIARKRREASIAAYYKPPKVDEASLPNNLTEYALNSGYYTSEEKTIIVTEAEDILKNIASKKWTSLEVAKAFCKASAYAQELTNCVTEVLYPEAMERAQYLDDYLAKNGKTIGPLHGLPISLKDSFIVPPHPASIGMAAFANEPLHKETLIVTILRELGAVFYIKTNVPVAMMMAESTNHVWGETRNALHKGCTPGGSTGGEGALIAFKASPLGIGTDIGGSVRIPAAFSHLYGLKPSFGRYPTWGGSPGFQLYSEALLSEQTAPWNLDHKCVPIPWRKNVIQPPGRKLRLGMIANNDGLVHCHPPVERALNITKQKLEAAGHSVISWEPKGHDILTKNLVAAFFDLGGAAIIDVIKPYEEPIFPSMKGYELASQAGEIGVTKMRQMVMKRNELQKEYLDYWMSGAADGKGPIDGIVMAVSPHAAPRLGGTQPDLYVGYTGVWNILDFAACTFPVTFADKTVDKPRNMSAFKPLSDIDGRIQADYDAEFYHGAPVSLQCVGKRLEEEKVLEMTDIISKALVQ